MLRLFVVLLLAAATHGQDCDADGIKLGEACTLDTDCNVGTCHIVHSKCSDSGVCECSLGYYGEDTTRLCEQYVIGHSCTGDESCQATVPNTACVDDLCRCGPGHYEEYTRLLEKYCLPIHERTSCTPGVEGDAYCSAGDKLGEMTCSAVTFACTCPTDHILVAEFQTCYESSSDASCANCLNTGGLCFLDETSTITCSCPTSKYSSTGDALATGCDRGSATINNICETDDSVTCADPQAECVHFGTMKKRFVCSCRVGYVSGPEWGRPDILVCHKELSSRQDENCAACNINEGKCYDIDEDNVHDICRCPTSRSTSDADDYSTYCDTLHVNVTCDSDSMSVCYTPHDTLEFPNIQNALTTGVSIMFVKGHTKNQNCYLAETSDGWCIDLEYGTLLSCDTAKHDLNEHTVSYTNWIILQRQPEKRTINDMFIYVYCSYDSLVNAFTGHVAVEIGEPPAIAAEGDLVQAGVRLDILDEFGNDAGKSGVILGQVVQLVANITDDKGVFVEIKAEVCLASNLPDLSSPFARTTLMLYDGCPEENSVLDENMIFKQDVGNTKVTRTNMFSMFKFDDSEYVFFHCALRVCMDGNVDECDASNCFARKKRAVSQTETGVPETGVQKRSADGMKMASAMKKFDSPDFQVSVSAIKIKRAVDQKQLEHVESEDMIEPSKTEHKGEKSGGLSDMFASNTMIIVVGALVGLLIVVIASVATIAILKRGSNKQADVESQRSK